MYAARIENGFVVQVVRTDAPPDGWVASNVLLALGSAWDGTTFTPPTQDAVDLDGRKADAINSIEARYAEVFRALTEDCPAEERDTWEIKRQAVVRYDAGEATATDLAMFDAECAHTGEAREVLIGTIRAKSAAYVGMIGDLRGIHRKAMHAVAAAPDAVGIEAALTTLESDIATFIGGLSP